MVKILDINQKYFISLVKFYATGPRCLKAKTTSMKTLFVSMLILYSFKTKTKTRKHASQERSWIQHWCTMKWCLTYHTAVHVHVQSKSLKISIWRGCYDLPVNGESWIIRWGPKIKPRQEIKHKHVASKKGYSFSLTTLKHITTATSLNNGKHTFKWY